MPSVAPFSFDAFFTTATTPPGEPSRAPYEYQRRLAGGDNGRPCESQLISIPTGLGKLPPGFSHFFPTPPQPSKAYEQ